MLYTINFEQDVCVGSCLHLHNVLFLEHPWMEQEGRHSWGRRWVLLSPNWHAKSSLYFQKIQCSCSFGHFQYIYIVRQLSITLHAQVTTTWNSSVDIDLKLGSTFISEELSGLCFSRAELLCPDCGLLLCSGKKYSILLSQLQSVGDAKMRY